MKTIHLNDFTIDLDDYLSFDYRLRELPSVGGGDDDGRLMIRLGVDGQRTQVYADLGRTGDLAAIEAGSWRSLRLGSTSRSCVANWTDEASAWSNGTRADATTSTDTRATTRSPLTIE